MNESILNALKGFIPEVLPEIVLGLVACVLFLGGTWKASRAFWGGLALVGLALAGFALNWSANRAPLLDARIAESAALQAKASAPGAPDADVAAAKAARQAVSAVVYAAPVVQTKLSIFFKVLGLATGVLLVLLGWTEAGEEFPGEYHGCLMLIVAGIGLVGSANDLITLFLALELISIPTYVLLYLPRIDAKAQEAAMKYFLLSIFSSGLLLFGFSYLYGLSGTTNIPAILETLNRGGDVTKTPWTPVALIAVIMVVAGLGFRITAVPFHFYAPDVYQGTTTPAAALLSFVPKIVGFAAMLRLLGYLSPSPVAETFPGRALSDQVPMLLWIMSAVTMTLGNILALLQDNIKRMLAYSSIANAGYMLIGMAVVPHLGGGAGELVGGVEALLFYLVAYGVMTVGAFAVLQYVSTPERPVEKIDDLAGLSKSHPGLALVMTLFVLSLIGIPATAGFAGKLQLFFTAVGAGTANEAPTAGLKLGTYSLFSFKMTSDLLCKSLAVIAALNAAVGAFYYLRIAVAMYLRDGIEPLPKAKPTPVLGAIALCAALTLGLGVWPKVLLEPIKAAVSPRAASVQE